MYMYICVGECLFNVYVYIYINICIYSPDTAVRESNDMWWSYLNYILRVGNEWIALIKEKGLEQETGNSPNFWSRYR